MRKVLIQLLVLLCLSGCVNPDNTVISKDTGTRITGKIKNGAGLFIWIEKITPNGFEPIDSLILPENAVFSKDISVDYPGFYALRNENRDYITFLCHGNDTVIIEANYYDFSRYNLRGSTELEEIVKLNQKTQEFLDEVSKYAKIISDSVESNNYRQIKHDIDKKYHKAFDKLKEFSVNFIERNEGSLITLLALTNQLGQDFYVFHPVKDFGFFNYVDSVLTEKYPDSEAVKQLHSRVERLKLNKSLKTELLKKGEAAPDFTIKDINGKNISLSEQAGNIIFLNFWASWCQPCQDQLLALKNIYFNFKKNDFEILQVSLDKNYDDWTKSISENELTWVNASELNFWNSRVAEIYGVQSIPANFLIDSQGIIIDVNLSPEQLKKELGKIFN